MDEPSTTAARLPALAPWYFGTPNALKRPAATSC